MTLNRQPYSMGIFEQRFDNVKWPTLRGIRLEDAAVSRLRQRAVTTGKSIIFLDGHYETNLNFDIRGPTERAVFYEWMIKGKTKAHGNIFLLCWIGDFHNGSIFHCGYQYPQVNAWNHNGDHGNTWMERKAYQVYKWTVTSLLGIGYNDPLPEDLDAEVREFLTNPSFT